MAALTVQPSMASTAISDHETLDVCQLESRFLDPWQYRVQENLAEGGQAILGRRQERMVR